MRRLILIPGLAGDTAMWQAQLAALPAAWNAVVTDVHMRHDSIPAMAQALLAEREGPLVLCGDADRLERPEVVNATLTAWLGTLDPEASPG